MDLVTETRSSDESEELLCLIHPRVSVAMMPIEDAKRHARSSGVNVTTTTFFKVEDWSSASEVRLTPITFRHVYGFCKLLESKIGITTSHMVLCVAHPLQFQAAARW